MNRIYWLFILSICFHPTHGQTEKLFEIKETINSSNKKRPKDFTRQNPNFFEDERYLVTRNCLGEFGGSVIFKNKTTGIEYVSSATCPVIINKIGGSYVLTSTLAHETGFSEIVEIKNPDSMYVLNSPESIKELYEEHAYKGTTLLLDSMGVLTLVSFPYNGQLFHIVTDYRKTFVAKIENKKFVTIDTISNESIWSYNSDVIKTTDNHYVFFFKNDKTKGYLDIVENKINLIRYK